MNSRSIAPHPPVTQLFCDRFQQGTSYSNWRPRGSEDWLLIHTDSGSGLCTTRLGSLVTQEHDVVLYAPGDLQDYRTDPAVGHWDLTWVHFRPRVTWDPWLQWPRHESGLQYLPLQGDENHEPFFNALLRMWEFSRRAIPGRLDFASNALEEALLWAHIVVSRTAGGPSDERVRRAADYLSAHLSEPFDLGKLAARCGLSVSRLSHLFKSETGYTPQQFLERRRMRHACHLLRLTGLSISEVAHEVGYDDPFYFSNRFRRSIGQSPLRFRQQRDSGTGEATNSIVP